MTESDECQLVFAARRGDREAYGALVERHQGEILRLCRRITGSHAEAEDLAHDAFVEAYLKLGQLRDVARFGGWLRRLALNLCRMWCRRRGTAALLQEPTAPEPVAPTGAAPSARMSGALSHLTAPHRLALVLYYFEGLDCEQMAAFLDVPVGTVMSRLHRARAVLRDVLRETADQEPPMTADDRFTEEVQAEIGVLLEMFADDPSAARRLAVILRQRPDRLGRLIAGAEDAVTLQRLAVLLPRLGGAAFEVGLELYFGSDATASARAGELLRQFAARCRPLYTAAWQGGMASLEVYLLVDRLVRFSAAAAAKAELLADLMEACSDDSAAALFTGALMCHPDEALRLLLDRFWSAGTKDALYERPRVLWALCRLGGRFCEALLDPLTRSGTGEQALAAAAFEAVSRCLEPRWLSGATPRQWADQVRVRLKWPPLRSADLAPHLLARLVERMGALPADPRGAVREAVLRTLGRLKAEAHLPSLVACTSHDDPATRRAALLALADCGGPEAARRLREVAQTGETAERRVAVEALGRLRDEGALPLLIRLTEDPQRHVQTAAVIALGELGGPEAHGLLGRLLQSGATHQRRAAARALFHLRRPAEHFLHAPSAREEPDEHRRPGDILGYCSVDGAIRFALDALRPYEERELNERIGRHVWDHCLARRRLVDFGLMTRAAGVYEFTELGRTVWRVEHHVLEHYLGRGIVTGCRSDGD
jgi:RNA polymerase sigma-70 factor (ECF subfamily)